MSVVCGIDEQSGPRTAAVARVLARDLDARLVAVHAVRPPGLMPPVAGPGGGPRHALAADELLAARRRYGRCLLESAAPDATHRCREGDPADVLVEVADEERADLLVVGRSRRGAIRRWFSRDVCFAAYGRASCPVVVVPPDCGSLSGDLLCIVCGIAPTTEALHAAARAADLARRARAQLVLVHVVDIPSPAPSVAAASLVPVPVAEVSEQRLREAGMLLATVQERVEGDVAIALRLETGNPGRTLERIAREEGADLIVVGRRGLGALGHAMLGSVSSHLCGHAEAPVAIAPPPVT